MKSENYRNYHLSFCSICINRKFNFDKGFVCNITNEIANFEKDCVNYCCDEKEKEKLEENLKIEIETNFPEQINSNLNLLFGVPFYKDSEQFNSEFKTSKKNIVYSTEYFSQYVVIGIFILASTFNLFRKNIDDFSFNASIVFIIVMISYAVYISLKEKKTIEIDTEGIIINKIKIYWNEIYRFGIKTIPGKHTEYKLIIFTITRGNKTISLNEYNVGKDKIIQIMKFYKKRCTTAVCSNC
jgi:hypothetical protein